MSRNRANCTMLEEGAVLLLDCFKLSGGPLRLTDLTERRASVPAGSVGAYAGRMP
ncbi:hypothetical protein ABZ547_10025 [Streptomyces sparsogenes]|uniref:hypothetical protein n=1 Tax=Streptomyces sparsogenes TaxID=67365 RepID=UPI0033FB8E53